MNVFLIFSNNLTVEYTEARGNKYPTVALPVPTIPYQPTPYRYPGIDNYRYSNEQRFCVYWFIWGDKQVYIQDR